MSEPLMQLLAELPLATPHPSGTDRIRMRCRAQLARQAPRTFFPRRVAAGHDRPLQVWQPLIAGLGIVYLTEVIVQALRVYGLP
jgi:hypothetical protein